jgi:hypothetical protein
MPDDFIPRKQTLTEADLKALAELLQCSKCSFNHDEADTLRSIAKNMNRATSLATKTIIAGIVLGFLSGTWFAIKHLIFEMLKTGAVPK